MIVLSTSLSDMSDIFLDKLIFKLYIQNAHNAPREDEIKNQNSNMSSHVRMRMLE